jgi:hypothetical protein
MTGIELRQFAVEADRKVIPNLAKLLLYNVEVVHQPLCSGGDVLFPVNGPSYGLIAFKKEPAVFRDARYQWLTVAWVRGYGLGRSEAFGVLLQALDAKKFAEKRLFGLGEQAYWRRSRHRVLDVLLPSETDPLSLSGLCKLTPE